MKIVDLLVKIANKEEVSYKIKYNGNIYEFDGETQNYLRHVNLGLDFLIDEDIVCLLNNEVEIIEEDKEIEKIEIFHDRLHMNNKEEENKLKNNFQQEWERCS